MPVYRLFWTKLFGNRTWHVRIVFFLMHTCMHYNPGPCGFRDRKEAVSSPHGDRKGAVRVSHSHILRPWRMLLSSAVSNTLHAQTVVVGRPYGIRTVPTRAMKHAYNHFYIFTRPCDYVRVPYLSRSGLVSALSIGWYKICIMPKWAITT